MNIGGFLTPRRTCDKGRVHPTGLYMDIFARIQARVAALLEQRIAAGALPQGLDLGRFVVEPPRDATHGDLSTNAAMVYAKEAKAAGSNARALAEALALGLGAEP